MGAWNGHARRSFARRMSWNVSCEQCCGAFWVAGGPRSILHRAIPDSSSHGAGYCHPVAVDPFAEAEVRYKSLVAQRRGGSLEPRAFRLAVRDLAVLDSEGHRWMLGPEDGIWYRRENERWLQADPPRRLVCPSCGHHNLGRHSFCVECGHRLNR